MNIRPGGPDDLGLLLGMLDDAVAWLVERGRAAQWGDRPWSDQPRLVIRATTLLSEGGAWVAEAMGEPAGVVVVSGEAPRYVPVVHEPETYVRLLVTARAHAGSGVGRELLEHARGLAGAAGSALLRVDCFGGGDQKLIRYYTDAGFTATEPYDLDGWPGQVLEQRLRPRP